MIKDIINTLNKELPATVKLVAVSKFHPFESIEEAYEAGQRIFAESRPQELLAKVRHLEEIRLERGDDYMADIKWHFIGHLQTNKLKMVLPYVSLVHSVDSERLLTAIDSWGAANGKVIDVLLEPHVASEESKQGFSPSEIYDIMDAASSDERRYGNIRFKGIMGMATFTDDESVIRRDFSALRDIHEKVRLSYPSVAEDFTELSIGMSDDYPIALEYGSTMVRIGSMIFGARNY
ncbi:MAG: YggS family pyridoxal phosphate-dependent enzyme [Bacteroidales bacterium]|nr:YggS family pyridoxal phosphate-dependent enzyme [Bacteroidales bacterium]